MRDKLPRLALFMLVGCASAPPPRQPPPDYPAVTAENLVLTEVAYPMLMEGRIAGFDVQVMSYVDSSGVFQCVDLRRHGVTQRLCAHCPFPDPPIGYCNELDLQTFERENDL